MKTNQTIVRLIFMLLGVFTAATASAQGTAFNYQGRLNANGTPANGSYDLTFELFSGSNGVNRLGNAFTNLNTLVTNGLFAVTLDFGSGVFTGVSVWLQVGVRTNGGTAFTLLAPLQPIQPVPYAIMANTASNLLGTLPATQVSGLLPASQLSGTVPDGRLSPNVALLNANQTYSGVNMFGNPANNFQGNFYGNGAGLTNLSNGLPAGTLLLSKTPTNSAYDAAGFHLDAVKLGLDWEPISTASPWGQLSYFGAVSNIGKMWVLGGGSGSFLSSNVWSSEDGFNWTQVTATAPWLGRSGHSVVAAHQNLYLLGGSRGETTSTSQMVNDTWSSGDGTNWSEFPPIGNIWTPRVYAASVEFNDKIWILGGSDGIPRNDVWFMAAPQFWLRATFAAGWAGRQGHAATKFSGKMWVMGGLTGPSFNLTPTNDVWSSLNGTNWTRVTAAAAWSPRTYFGLTVFNGKMWVMGGNDVNAGVRRNDVWSSVDGTNWTLVANSAAWSPRIGHAALAFNEALWVLSGLCDSISCSDVWSSQGITNMVGGYYLFQKK